MVTEPTAVLIYYGREEGEVGGERPEIVLDSRLKRLRSLDLVYQEVVLETIESWGVYLEQVS